MQLKTQKENTNGYEEYCYKIVKSGKYTEVYIYYDNVFKRKTQESKELLKEINEWDITINEKELSKKEKKKMKKEIEEVEEEEKLEKVKKDDTNLKRSQKRLRRLIDSNLNQYEEQDKFLTLTFPKLKNREDACRAFKSFVKNLRYNYGENIQYITVMEIQNGDRLEDSSKATHDIHFHVLLFNCPYVPQKIMQDKIWKHGIVDIRKIEKYGDVGGYLVNYLSKDDTLCVKGKRSYLPSKQLKKPIEIISMNEEMVFELLRDVNNKVQYNSEFYVEHVGRIGYIKMIENEDKEKTVTTID